MAQNTPLISVAIDFGTTYSGYAFSFTTDKEKVQTVVWEWDGFQSEKTPTNILFDENQQFVSFGFQAERDFVEKERQGKTDTVYFFKLFKLKLYRNKNLNRTTEIEDYSRKKKMMAVDVFSAGIKFLKNHFLETAQARGIQFSEDDVQWVLTVPAIWDDAAKQFMRESANKAGIDDGQLLLGLEPEAASVHCLLNKEDIDGLKNRLKAGDQYMVIDNGGGTVDVAIHKVLDSCKVEEIFKASGGDWGGMRVDDAFQEWLMEIFDVDCLEGLSLYDKLKLVSEFQKTKQNICTRIFDKVSIWIPDALKSHFSENDWVGKVRLLANRMRINKEIYEQCFQESVQKIIEHVESIFNESILRFVDVPLIIMVGGFSNSDILEKEMRRNFPQKTIVVPGDASTAVLKGAVQMGHNKSLVSGRISSYTYGVGMCSNFIEGYHDPKYKFTAEGKIKCKHLFQEFVTIGQKVKFGYMSEKISFSPLYSYQDSMCFSVFRSTKRNPTYTTETNCEEIGKLSIPLSMDRFSDRSVEAQMKFGTIELTLTVEDYISGEIRTGKFDFLSSK